MDYQAFESKRTCVWILRIFCFLHPPGLQITVVFYFWWPPILTKIGCKKFSTKKIRKTFKKKNSKKFQNFSAINPLEKF